MLFQTLIDAFIVKGPGPQATALWKKWMYLTKFVPFPVPSQKKDSIADNLGQLIGLFLVLAFMWPYSRMVRNIVAEKEERLREGMRVMGMPNLSFWLSWIATYGIIYTVVAIVVTLILCGQSQFFRYSSPVIIFLIFWLFGMSLIAFGCAISSMFNVSKTSGTLALALLLCSWLPAVALNEDSFALLVALFNLLPCTAMTNAFAPVLTFEQAFIGVNPGATYTYAHTYTC